MKSVLAVLAVVPVAYLVGAVPVANLFARATRGTDLRRVGSGTVSGTGLYRVAGLPALLAAGVLDVAKGAAGPLIAGTVDSDPAVVAAAGAGVAGHNWSVFLRFAGGRGLSPAIGALLVIAWPGAVLLLFGLALGRALGESALGAFAAILALPVALAATGDVTAALTGATLTVVLLAKRLAGNAPVDADHPRVYVTRLLFDRDQR